MSSRRSGTGPTNRGRSHHLHRQAGSQTELNDLHPLRLMHAMAPSRQDHKPPAAPQTDQLVSYQIAPALSIPLHKTDNSSPFLDGAALQFQVDQAHPPPLLEYPHQQEMLTFAHLSPFFPTTGYRQVEPQLPAQEMVNSDNGLFMDAHNSVFSQQGLNGGTGGDHMLSIYDLQQLRLQKIFQHKMGAPKLDIDELLAGKRLGQPPEDHIFGASPAEHQPFNRQRTICSNAGSDDGIFANLSNQPTLNVPAMFDTVGNVHTGAARPPHGLQAITHPANAGPVANPIFDAMTAQFTPSEARPTQSGSPVGAMPAGPVANHIDAMTAQVTSSEANPTQSGLPVAATPASTANSSKKGKAGDSAASGDLDPDRTKVCTTSRNKTQKRRTQQSRTVEFKGAPDADIRLAPEVFSVADVLSFLPRHTTWPRFMFRLLAHDWKLEEIAMVQLHARGYASAERVERQAAALRQQIRKNREAEAGRPGCTTKQAFAAASGNVQPTISYDASTYSARPDKSGQAPQLYDIALKDLAEGVINFPTGEDAGILTKAVQYAVDHPNEKLMMSDLPDDRFTMDAQPHHRWDQDARGRLIPAIVANQKEGKYR